jgi:hypothetical protein
VRARWRPCISVQCVPPCRRAAGAVKPGLWLRTTAQALQAAACSALHLVTWGKPRGKPHPDQCMIARPHLQSPA